MGIHVDPQSPRQWPTPSDQYEEKLTHDVREFGWHVIGIADDDEGPGFVYSIGLMENFGHPEIVMFGLPTETQHAIINTIGDLIGGGNTFADLDESDEVLDGLNVFFRRVEKKHYAEYFGYALWFYQGDNFEVLQCFWPDAEQRYPWHPDAEQGFVGRQPLLNDMRAWPFPAGRNRAAFCTKPVVEGTHPILIVVHDEDDDWQFLCGTTTEAEEAELVGLGCVVDLDPKIVELADLPRGWCATRDSVGQPWERSPMEPESDES
jgi:hypothetical protein